MNNFTKDDLELIKECVDSDFNITNWPRSMYEPLMNKIQFLIDNYCEHEMLVSPANPMCIKCKRYVL